ncbi:MAG: YwqG family protein [Leptolyngbyaceae cyanobacterium bins.302]|nr:YwqG family protein [Leptolyngbyaceae cyanobacterium bins.302]
MPKALQRVREEFLATKTSFIHIEPFETDDPLELWTSKYRGLPYLPLGTEYPTSIDGDALVFLAQINFAEVPVLADYPTSGILQFFISDNDLYGLEFVSSGADVSQQFALQQQQNYFRVIYYPEVITNVEHLVTDFDFLLNETEEFVPIENQCRLEFSLREEYVGFSDYQFTKLLGTNFLQSLNEEDADEFLDSEIINNAGNKIGGYAFFTQSDVRELAPVDENWRLLLQIDEAENAEIMWGDVGVGNFFIEEKDLRNLNFSRVVYNWDCH